ncbi:unnamed protein product [Owenia fusiformis]|uniref:Uncharacterized protein n=1 Tax=Owenia fusiformis TaxID=6347 RepID=A0A8S4PW05_OWEFU|nr:unnamed protein product [Owenia fusiformis]
MFKTGPHSGAHLEHVLEGKERRDCVCIAPVVSPPECKIPVNKEVNDSLIKRPPPPQPSDIFIPSPAVESSEACLRHCLTTIDEDLRILMEERDRIVMEFEARGLYKPDCPIIIKYVVQEVNVEKSISKKIPLRQRAKDFFKKIVKNLGLKK